MKYAHYKLKCMHSTRILCEMRDRKTRKDRSHTVIAIVIMIATLLFL